MKIRCKAIRYPLFAPRRTKAIVLEKTVNDFMRELQQKGIVPTKNDIQIISDEYGIPTFLIVYISEATVHEQS